MPLVLTQSPGSISGAFLQTLRKQGRYHADMEMYKIKAKHLSSSNIRRWVKDGFDPCCLHELAFLPV